MITDHNTKFGYKGYQFGRYYQDNIWTDSHTDSDSNVTLLGGGRVGRGSYKEGKCVYKRTAQWPVVDPVEA